MAIPAWWRSDDGRRNARRTQRSRGHRSDPTPTCRPAIRLGSDTRECAVTVATLAKNARLAPPQPPSAHHLRAGQRNSARSFAVFSLLNEVKYAKPAGFALKFPVNTVSTIHSP